MNENYAKYLEFVKKFNTLHREAAKIPLGDYVPAAKSAGSGPKVLIFSPHPDDECVVGALPLRLLHELDAQVVNVAVTLGSNVVRKDGRLNELKKACATLGFILRIPGTGKSLDGVNLTVKEKTPSVWRENCRELETILAEELPEMIFFPHNNDFNSTHIGTHYLSMEAIKAVQKKKSGWQPLIFETEFWQMMEKPNLFIALSEEDEAQLIFALSAHTGEVERNPYHINHPARMLDNVTRGAEVVGGQGGKAPKCDFAMLYRCSKIIDGEAVLPWQGGIAVGIDDSLQKIFSDIS